MKYKEISSYPEAFNSFYNGISKVSTILRRSSISTFFILPLIKSFKVLLLIPVNLASSFCEIPFNSQQFNFTTFLFKHLVFRSNCTDNIFDSVIFKLSLISDFNKKVGKEYEII